MAEEAAETSESTEESTAPVTADEMAGAESKGEATASTDDWRDSVTDTKLRTHAGQFTSVVDLVGKHYELRRQLSTAINPLTADATDEQIATFRERLGVPKTADLYEFASPEGHEPTEDDKAFQASAAEMFHRLNIPADAAKGLNEWWNGMTAKGLESQLATDKAFAEEATATLKNEWPGEEYATNKNFAQAAVAELFPGDILTEVRNLETKAGNFVLDDPNFLRVFAHLGRQMETKGSLAPMSDGERGAVDATVADLRSQAQEAHARGDFSVANKLSEQERDLYSRRDGAQPLVGAEGRAA